MRRKSFRHPNMCHRYRSTDRLCRGGAAVKNLAQSASLHAGENNAPSKPGTKHLVGSSKKQKEVETSPSGRTSRHEPWSLHSKPRLSPASRTMSKVFACA